MTIFKVIILAIVQGLAELLPVSSSAHVVVAEKLMGLDPSAPQMTLLLVMLHTGTMFAVLVYFWSTWKMVYFSSRHAFRRFAVMIVWATLLTGLVGGALIKIIEKTLFRNAPKEQIESLFSHLELVAPALAAAGILILIAGLAANRKRDRAAAANRKLSSGEGTLTLKEAGWMGLVQGLALPFRGFSRSGSTISAGMLAGAAKEPAERFSFAMAVVLTPPVVLREALRLLSTAHRGAAGSPVDLHSAVAISLLGALLSFIAGLAALKWLSSWLESGRWHWFGIYCLCASAVVFYLHARGF